MPETDASIPDDAAVLRDKYLRALADLDNLSKRARRDADAARDEGEAHVARAFLPLVDDLRRALEFVRDADGETLKEQVLSGLALIKGKFLHTLAQLQIEGFESQGKQFAAELMEAIAEVPTNLLPAGTVVAELEQGFKRRGKLLQPSRVAVAVPEPKVEDGDEPDAA